MLALAVSAAALAPVVALAQGGGGPKHDAATVPETYASTCARGNASYAAHDFEGAIALYRHAMDIDPKSALAPYLLGEAQLAAGHVAEADATWTLAAQGSREKSSAPYGRVLFVLADVKERQRKWEDAKAAWQAYLDWTNQAPDGGAFPGTARSRLQAIAVKLDQDKAEEPVRERIAATRDGGVFTDPSKARPGAK